MIAYGDLDWVFEYHPPIKSTGPSGSVDQEKTYTEIREAAKSFAKVILSLTPACGDQDNAIRLVRQAMHMANSSIALQGRC
jgi:hypothetical protein